MPKEKVFFFLEGWKSREGRRGEKRKPSRASFRSIFPTSKEQNETHRNWGMASKEKQQQQQLWTITHLYVSSSMSLASKNPAIHSPCSAEAKRPSCCVVERGDWEDEESALTATAVWRSMARP